MARRLTTLGGLLLSVGMAVATTLAVSVPAHAQATLPTKAQWKVDVHTAKTGSNRWLDERLQLGGTRLAINLDIDNTSLATHYAPGHGVPWVRHFARHASGDHLALLFNTGRLQGHGRLRGIRAQLETAGFHVTEMCGRHDGEGLVHSKQRCRQHYVDEGYTLIANIGNNRTDFVGTNYERAFRLPNYGVLG